MSAGGRLWRRAPAWRLSLVAALALSELAAMYPPNWRGRFHAGSSSGLPTFVDSTTAEKPSDRGFLNLPEEGAVRSGVIDFAGRRLPLPAGSWQTLALVSTSAGLQQLMLDKVVEHRLTGLLIVEATGALGGPPSPVGVPRECEDSARLAGAIVPARPADSPLMHECWAIVPVNMKVLAGEHGPPPIVRGLARLVSRGTVVPDRMLAPQFMRSDDHGWQSTTVLVPDKGATTTALANWAEQYSQLLHKGFGGETGSGNAR